MPNNFRPKTLSLFGVAISSTFTDLEEHRGALIRVIRSQGLGDLAMENESFAKPIDVLESSLEIIGRGTAYVGIIGMKYGQVPACPTRNPDNLSVTELEFNEALRLDLPILLFIMGKDHLLTINDIEDDPVKRVKLDAFRERAKKMGADNAVNRVYAVFNSLQDFKDKAGLSITGIHRYLDEQTRVPDNVADTAPAVVSVLNPVPRPPALYAEPSYLGSHRFVGRQSQLEALNDWARPADPHTMLIFDAIGGNGKSMLTWEWATNHATRARSDWAGIFWYSFYERGAVMADFCRCALVYITGYPFDEFKKKKTRELTQILLHQLKARPWLLILDGLERVLVAYNRFDATEVRDEELNTPSDKIVNRDPCSCINDEDDELLRSLATVAPSKILVSSRLAPRILFNAANQPVPGVQRIVLPGLRPADAEAMFRSCSITGNAEAIQSYLSANCDCHPLIIGILAGLVNNYLPAKGNFDVWVTDPAGGGQLNFAELNLVQKRNHILKVALHALPEKSLELLSTLALLSDAVDYSTLCAFNPHIPPEPKEVTEPEKPELNFRWEGLSDPRKKVLQERYTIELLEWEQYQQAMFMWKSSNEYLTAGGKLTKTVHDLELRGLLQYDHHSKRYDLHPVVRGVAAGGLQSKQKEEYGQLVVDHFSSQASNPYEQAESLDDLRNALYILRTLLKMEHYQEAVDSFQGELCIALLYNLEAYKEILALIQPFFSTSWRALPSALDEDDGCYLVSVAAIAFDCIGECKEAMEVYQVAILLNLKQPDSRALIKNLSNVASNLFEQNRIVTGSRIFEFALSLANISDHNESLFLCRLSNSRYLTVLGQYVAAEELWTLADSMGRDWRREAYGQGEAEYFFEFLQFLKGHLKEEHLIVAEQLATGNKNRKTIRDLHYLRGIWRMEQNEWMLASESLNEAVRMARAIEYEDSASEAMLALAKWHLGQLSDPSGEAGRLACMRQPAHETLAKLWLAIGNHDEANKHALEAYKWACADGEPYVRRYELDQAIELLNKLGVTIPQLSPYDPSKDIKLPWEDKVVAFIEQVKAKKSKNEVVTNSRPLYR